MRYWRVVLYAVVFIVVLFYFFINAGVFLQSPSVAPQKADIIVALGGDNGSRVLKAGALWKQGYAPMVLLTGLEGQPGAVRLNYLNWRAKVLLGTGLPQDNLLFDSVSKNSFEEARNTYALMRNNSWHKVIVVSDPPHMRRLDWAWSSVFKDREKIDYLLVQTQPTWWNSEKWWDNDVSAQFVLMEYIKLFYYVFYYGVWEH